MTHILHHCDAGCEVLQAAVRKGHQAEPWVSSSPGFGSVQFPVPELSGAGCGPLNAHGINWPEASWCEVFSHALHLSQQAMTTLPSSLT